MAKQGSSSWQSVNDKGLLGVAASLQEIGTMRGGHRTVLENPSLSRQVTEPALPARPSNDVESRAT